jgi:hypothetical protein
VIYISINHNHKQKSEEAVKGTYDYANYTFKKVFATYDYANYTFKKVFATYGTSITF